MAKQLITVNGRPIYSNVPIRQISNERITFTDGSWCDVRTGDIHLATPSSYVGFEPQVEPSLTEEMQCPTSGSPYRTASSGAVEGTRRREPQLYSGVTRVVVSKMVADLTVMSHTEEFVSVEMKGEPSQLDGISVTEHSGCLWITDSSRGSIGRSSGGLVINGGRSGTITIGGRVSGSRIVVGDLSITLDEGDGGRGSDVSVTVKVPVGTGIEVEKVEGDVTIGDTRGSVKLSLHNVSSARVGQVNDADLSASGTGGIQVEEVTGKLSIKISGTGAVSVNRGEVTHLDVVVSGVGAAVFNGRAQSADLRLSGIGDIKVAHVVAEPRIRKSGMGYVRVERVGS